MGKLETWNPNTSAEFFSPSKHFNYDFAHEFLANKSDAELIEWLNDDEICDSYWYTGYEILRERGVFLTEEVI